MNESVTVVIACYNHVEYLEEALDSVKSQTMLPAQLIVTDDASSDGSADLIAGWLADNWPDAVFIRNQNNQGFPATLNLAIPHVTGTFLAIMSADDQMCEDRLELQARALMAWPEAGMVYSDMLEVRPDGELTGQRWFDSDRQGPALPPTSQPGSPVDLYLPMLERAFISAPTVLMRTAALREAGCYDEHLIAEDYDMFLRLSRSWYWVYLPEPATTCSCDYLGAGTGCIFQSRWSSIEYCRRPWRGRRGLERISVLGVSTFYGSTWAAIGPETALSLAGWAVWRAGCIKKGSGDRRTPGEISFWRSGCARRSGSEFFYVDPFCVSLGHGLCVIDGRWVQSAGCLMSLTFER